MQWRAYVEPPHLVTVGEGDLLEDLGGLEANDVDVAPDVQQKSQHIINHGRRVGRQCQSQPFSGMQDCSLDRRQGRADFVSQPPLFEYPAQTS